MPKTCFELSRAETWTDFEYPIAIRRPGRADVVGWAAEQTEAAMLVYAVNTRRDGKRYLPPVLEQLAGGGRCAEESPQLEVDASGRHAGVAGCATALTCNGRVIAWMKHPRHARFIAQAVNRVMVA